MNWFGGLRPGGGLLARRAERYNAPMRNRHTMVALVLAWTTFWASGQEQTPSGYKHVEGFPQLPGGMKFGAGSGVATDSKGDVLVFHRGEPPILVFRPDGQFVRSFGDKLFKSAHGMRVDADDNVWVTDNADHIVVKFDKDAKVLMTLGERGVAAEDERHFNKPADVAVAANGDVFVADGYGNSRVVKFDKTGKFLTAWGRKGNGKAEFNLPHAIRIDSKGRVYVGDRENNRVQVFEQDGTYVREFGGMAPFGLFITPDDTLFVADGRTNRIQKMTLEGKVLATWAGRLSPAARNHGGRGRGGVRDGDRWKARAEVRARALSLFNLHRRSRPFYSELVDGFDFQRVGAGVGLPVEMVADCLPLASIDSAEVGFEVGRQCLD